MEFVCGFWPGRGYACRARLDSRRRASGHAPAIRRSIWSVLLYCLGPTAGHIYIPELFYLCLYGEVEQAGVPLELPLCPDRVVVGQPHCAMMVRALMPHRRTEVVIYASGSFWLGA